MTLTRGGGIVLATFLCLAARAVPSVAQNPARPFTPRAIPDSVVKTGDSLVTRERTRGDSIRPKPPITPGGAFLRSLVLPGWGQAALQRNVTGGVFMTFEGIALTMVWKSSWQVRYAEARDKLVKSHKQELQDWLILLAFNHLMSGAEAYVSGHLYDFPASLKFQTLSHDRVGLGVSVPF